MAALKVIWISVWFLNSKRNLRILFNHLIEVLNKIAPH